jgi:hypothetical protein
MISGSIADLWTSAGMDAMHRAFPRRRFLEHAQAPIERTLDRDMAPATGPNCRASYRAGRSRSSRRSDQPGKGGRVSLGRPQAARHSRVRVVDTRQHDPCAKHRRAIHTNALQSHEGGALVVGDHNLGSGTSNLWHVPVRSQVGNSPSDFRLAAAMGSAPNGRRRRCWSCRAGSQAQRSSAPC